MACDAVIVRRVERTLALAQPKDFLIPVQQILLDEADKDLFWYSVRGERAVLDRLFHKMDAGIISIDDLSSSNPSASSDGIVSSMTNWGYKAHLASDRALSLELMTQVYDARRMIERQQRAELKRLDRAYHDLPHADLDCLLTRTMTPAFTKIHDASLRAKANLRSPRPASLLSDFGWQAVVGRIRWKSFRGTCCRQFLSIHSMASRSSLFSVPMA